MHKLILKYFDLVKNLLQFIKIFMFFSILMLMFYWIENIINSNWDWLSFIKPYLAFFVNIGESISKDSINVFGAVFEYKYFIAAVLFLVINVFAELLIRFVDWTKDIYGDGRLLVKKLEEKAFNKSLEKNNIDEQKQVKSYLVYVSTSIKKRYDYNGSGVNLEEQNKIMIKFLMEKTGLVPEKFESGFLFSFNDFNNIDSLTENEKFRHILSFYKNYRGDIADHNSELYKLKEQFDAIVTKN